MSDSDASSSESLITKPSASGVNNPGSTAQSGDQNPPLLDQVFSMIKDYLQDKLEEKSKQFEEKIKVDKQVTQLHFKGNQKQYEFNAEIDRMLDKIKKENQKDDRAKSKIKKIIEESKALIHKRQKLIRIADKSKDGWYVVEEYEPDELASGSEDDKRLKKAREAASKKRKVGRQGGHRETDRKRERYIPDEDN